METTCRSTLFDKLTQNFAKILWLNGTTTIYSIQQASKTIAAFVIHVEKLENYNSLRQLAMKI